MAGNMLITGATGGGTTTLMRHYAQYLATRRDTVIWVFSAVPPEWDDVRHQLDILTGGAANRDGAPTLDKLFQILEHRMELGPSCLGDVQNLAVFFDWYDGLALPHEPMEQFLGHCQSRKIQAIVAARPNTIMENHWLRHHSSDVVVLPGRGGENGSWKMWRK